MECISIIVPVYQVEDYLPKCIESILQQSYTNLDIILIDDGSTDRSGEICESYAKTDSRIRAFHTENIGVSAARNYGLKMARDFKSDYLAFADGDDYLEPHFIELMYHNLNSWNADIATCGYSREWKNRQTLFVPDEVYYTGKEALHALIDGKIYTMVWGKLYRKELFDNVVFPEGRTFEDIAVFFNVVSFARSVICVGMVGYHWVMRSSSITHNYNSIQNIFDWYRAYKERYDRLTADLELACDHKLEKGLLKGCVISAFLIWRHYNGFPHQEKEQYREELHSIAAFLHGNVPALGFSDWEMLVRIYALFVRHDSKLSLAAVYGINWIYQILRIEREHLYTDE